MPSEPPNNQALIKKLSDITTSLQRALDENNFEELTALSEAHKLVSEELKRVGLSRDRALINLIKETLAHIQSVSMKLQKRKEEIRRQLTVLGNRKKLRSVYHGSHRS